MRRQKQSSALRCESCSAWPVQAESEPPGLRRADQKRRRALETGDEAAAAAAEMQLIAALLENLFGLAEVDLKEGTVVAKVAPSLLGINSSHNNNYSDHNNNYSDSRINSYTFPNRGLGVYRDHLMNHLWPLPCYKQ
jgi:hypothetical protein